MKALSQIKCTNLTTLNQNRANEPLREAFPDTKCPHTPDRLSTKSFSQIFVEL